MLNSAAPSRPSAFAVSLFMPGILCQIGDMSDIALPLMHLFWIVPLVLLIAYLGSPRFRGTMGEERVQRLLNAALPRSQYSILKGIVIPSGGGTRRIPHLVVSQFGIFVIQPVHRPGRITGATVQDLWTQRKWGRRHRFDNPMHQAVLNIQALERLLNIPGLCFHPLVAFSSESYFTGTSPEDVIPAEKLIPFIKRRGQKLMEADTCGHVLKVLKETRLDDDGKFSVDRWTLARWFLGVLLLAGCWFAYETQILALNDTIQRQLKIIRSPEHFHPDGREKSEQELWEGSLICAYSDDTGRCACYDPSGNRAELDTKKCKELAEKDSVLKR